MTAVKYAYYKPSHIDKTTKSRRQDDAEAIKFLEDKLLEVFKGIDRISKDAPADVKYNLNSLICFANPWSLDGDQIDNVCDIYLDGSEDDEDDDEELDPAVAMTAALDPKAKKIIDMFKGTSTKIVGVGPGQSVEIGLDGSVREAKDVDDSYEDDVDEYGDTEDSRKVYDDCADASVDLVVKFAKSFTGKDGKKYEAGEKYTIKVPNKYTCESTHERVVWDPDCMDEVERYVKWYLQDTLLGEDSDKELTYVFAHLDDAVGPEYYDEDDLGDGDDEDEAWDGISGCSAKKLRECGSVIEVGTCDHSGNEKLTEYHCPGWKDSLTVIPFYVMNISDAVEQLYT